MGAKAKAQRPKKRKSWAPTGEDEGPPRRMRKKGGPPDAEPEWEGPCAEDEGREKERREELAALEALLFGAPTSTETPSEEGAPESGPSSAEKNKRKRRAKPSSNSSDAAAAAATTEDGGESDDTATEAEAGGARRAAWVDPEDAKLRIDIDTNPKLRKLKTRKGEKFISGEEYQKRLQSLHNKLIGTRQGLDWIEQARLRKMQAAAEAEEG